MAEKIDDRTRITRASEIVPYTRAEGTTCRAHGDGWSCDRHYNYVAGGYLCQAHYRQYRKGKPFTPLRKYREVRKVLRHDPNDMLCEVPLGHQSCTECGVIQPLSNFTKKRNGLKSVCRACWADYSLNITYGDGAATWKKETIAKQGHRCPLCKTDDPRGKNGWSLDHDHDTGEWRGVLCQPCNHRVGHIEKALKDGLLDTMLDYIKTNGESVRPSCTSHRESSSSEAFE